jgi:hypothetical protein
VKRYRISRETPNGATVTTTCELNAAAVVAHLQHGDVVAYVGPSHVRVYDEETGKDITSQYRAAQVQR